MIIFAWVILGVLTLTGGVFLTCLWLYLRERQRVLATFFPVEKDES